MAMTTVRLETDMHKTLKIVAAQEGSSLQKIVSEALAEWLKTRGIEVTECATSSPILPGQEALSL